MGPDKIWQEIHCTNSGGGCGGYIVVGLNRYLDQIVSVICPKCKHEHRRKIRNGKVEAKDRWLGKPVEEICPTLAAWSAEPRTAQMLTMPDTPEERDGAVIAGPGDLLRERTKEFWFETHGGQE